MKQLRPSAMFTVLAILLTACPVIAADDPLAIFEKRIVPILKSPKPSSCSECHLSGVDLKDYIRDDAAQTFAALRSQGLIDLKSPEKSKLLEFIARKPAKPTIVSETVRDEELAAFKAWILAAMQDPKMLAAKEPPHKSASPSTSIELIRHARMDRVLKSFEEIVLSESLRCAGCHDPSKNQKQAQKNGDHISWVRGKDAAATLAWLVEHDQINLKDPAKSLLLTKPTNQVEHGGGVKLTVGDRTYTQFLNFITDYAAALKGEYKSAKELPAPNPQISVASEIWFKLTDIPAPYIGKTLRAEIFAETNSGWSKTPVAVADRLIYPKSTIWQQHLTLVAERNTPQAAALQRNELKLPPGKYKVVVTVDVDDKLQQSPPQPLREADITGTLEVRSNWPAGYGAMTVAKFPTK